MVSIVPALVALFCVSFMWARKLDHGTRYKYYVEAAPLALADESPLLAVAE